MFLLNSGSGSVFSVLQSPVSREETEGVINRHARSPTAALGDVPGGKKRDPGTPGRFPSGCW